LIKSGLKTVYAAQFGRIKLSQRLLMLPDTVTRDTQLREELIQSFKIQDEQLKQLASFRANAVKSKLLDVDGTLAERITIGDSEVVVAENGVVPIRVNMERGH
jgi:hypothetical protein